MTFNEIQLFDTCDDLDSESIENLLLMFKKDFLRFDSDIYEYIYNLETKDIVLLFMIAQRCMNFYLEV